MKYSSFISLKGAPQTASRSDSVAHKENFPVKIKAKRNQDHSVSSSLSCWWLLGTLIYVYPQLPTPVCPQWLPWHEDSLGRCLLASPSGPQWVTLTESRAKKIQCLPLSGPILSPQQQTTPLSSKINLVARSYGNTSRYEKLASVLAEAFGLSRKLTT